MDDSTNFGVEFRSIQELEKKKFLKTPDYQEAIERYRKLANEMEAGEHYGNANTCHVRIAELYALLQNPLSERQHWLKAASLNRKSGKERTLHAHPSTASASNSHSSVEECYNRAAEIASNLEHQLQAGSTYIELASYLAEQQECETAHHYFVKAASLLDADFHALGTVIEGMCKLCRHELSTAQLEEIFRDIHLLWTRLLKRLYERGAPNGLMRLECLVVLVSVLNASNDGHQLLVVEPAEKILHTYTDADFQKSCRLTTMGEKQFNELSSFIRAILNKDELAAKKSHAVMSGFLAWWDDEYEALINRILSRMPAAEDEGKGTNAFHTPSSADNRTDELERRQQMFELQSESLTKRRISLEDI